MKLWINNSGQVVGYESDFEPGTPGFTLVERDLHATETPAVTAVEPVEQDERAALEALYVEKVGKRPHPAMKLETMRKVVGQ